jgi:Nucleoside-diphosphate-sugar epimerases
MCSLNILFDITGGGSGFIGSAFNQLLRSKGYGVVIVSRMPGPQRISWVSNLKLIKL